VATGTDKPTYRHVIGGDWVGAADGATFDDSTPTPARWWPRWPPAAASTPGAQWRPPAERLQSGIVYLKWVTVQSGTRAFPF
jgi:hypothetical protein